MDGGTGGLGDGGRLFDSDPDDPMPLDSLGDEFEVAEVYGVSLAQYSTGLAQQEPGECVVVTGFRDAQPEDSVDVADSGPSGH